jgi:hypothetical protein
MRHDDKIVATYDRSSASPASLLWRSEREPSGRFSTYSRSIGLGAPRSVRLELGLLTSARCAFGARAAELLAGARSAELLAGARSAELLAGARSAELLAGGMDLGIFTPLREEARRAAHTNQAD